MAREVAKMKEKERRAKRRAEPPPAPEPTLDLTPNETRYQEAMTLVMGMDQTKESMQIAKFSTGRHRIRLTDLKWDTTLEYGQCRVRRRDRVRDLKNELGLNRPRVPIPILVWDGGGMYDVGYGRVPCSEVRMQLN